MSAIDRKLGLFVGAALAALSQGTTAFAQDAAAFEDEEAIVVTGTRIRSPGVVSASPIDSVDAEEIARQQQPELERVIRVLPITIPGDGQNTNNGTIGAATLNLRGLGPQRNLIMMDGQRVTPFGPPGTVDTQVIPTALIERIDIITGGASATYGSDAISGAINMIMRRDFEGVDLTYNRSITGEGDGEINSAALTMGAGLENNRGNVTLSLNYGNREGVLFGARPLGRLGIVTADGGGYSEFLSGQPPLAPPAGCGGDDTVATSQGGSSRTVPTRLSIAGGPGLGQFRDDGTIGANCSLFNFNPYNYYQTPQERFGGSAIGYFDVNENVEAYARFSFAKTAVDQQVAPSGLFSDTFWVPLSNPLIGASARNTIVSTGETGRVGGTVVAGGSSPNWRDQNSNGVVDAPDDLLLSFNRRTVELGPRSTTNTQDWYQLVFGVRGDFNDSVHYDLSFSHGESDRTLQNFGYTNVTHIADQLYSLDGVTCALTSDTACVPINLFGGQGTITPQAAAYASATGILRFGYSQTVGTGVISGDLPFQSPWASSPVAFSVGAEYREEEGFAEPDECFKLAPASCMGGFGGNVLPIHGGFNAFELFGETIIPLLEGQPFAESLSLELGYRASDFEPSGQNESWKYGLSWEPIDGLRFRAMQQRAVRAPNVGEIASPITSGLDNAAVDPCSIGNAANIDATLRALCISTGMTNAQVGTVEDLVSNQVNVFIGSDPLNLPAPESANTTTIGFVWQPDLGESILRPTLTVDYYDIQIDNYINAPPAQSILDGCYLAGDPNICARVRRVGGTLTIPGSGLTALTTNLETLGAEGLEIGAQFGLDVGSLGTLRFTFNGNHYLSNEFTDFSVLGATNCKGVFAASCGGNFGTPLPTDRWIQRTLWEVGDFEFSYLWRHLSSVESSLPADQIFPAFQSIDAYDYIDLSAAWQVNENARLMVSVTNVTEQDPPVVGNEAADTASNSGNTFPSTYDTLGQVWSVGFNVRF
ncbi:MAG: TonB-dependent receptor [Terricaulis sp.]